LIPCLLVSKGGLVKTVKFGQPKYVGDPLNAVRIFNEKEVDELAVLDIDATKEGREPDYELIKNLAAECRMPLCYGGGVKTVQQAQKIIALGVEKVAISSAAVEDLVLVSAIAEKLGSQSVVIILDVKRSGLHKRNEVFVRNGTKGTGHDPVDFSRQMQEHGAGEIVLNSIDRDGTMEGYDLELVKAVRAAVHVPVTVLGGAGSLNDVATLVQEFGTIGAAAGSLFVFKGKYRAVLINYPRPDEKRQLMAAARSKSAHAAPRQGGLQ
jgi:cyclase